MDETAPVPSISSGTVGSRFVSQDDLEKAKVNREEQWKAAYARLGQEPPPLPQEDTAYDGRSLYEKLQTQKVAKEEAWQEQHKLSKQFRALEEDEVRFLETINQKKRDEEAQRKKEEGVELAGFREAVAARSALPPPPVLGGTSPPTASSSKVVPQAARKEPPKPKLGKKDQKTLLKGVVVRKKEKEKDKSTEVKGTAVTATTTPAGDSTQKQPDTKAGEPPDEPTAKRRKLG